jgi:hypothetical protein
MSAAAAFDDRDWRQRRAAYLASAGRLTEIEAEGLQHFIRGEQLRAIRQLEQIRDIRRRDQLRLRREAAPTERTR